MGQPTKTNYIMTRIIKEANISRDVHSALVYSIGITVIVAITYTLIGLHYSGTSFALQLHGVILAIMRMTKQLEYPIIIIIIIAYKGN